ncbi:MAG: glycosyltransferase 87 family protein [Patescibacteria group bacterium]
MNLLALDAILLYVFSIPPVMRYRILPSAGTPYWLFGILFLVLTLNLIISLYPEFWEKRLNLFKSKAALLWLTLLIVLGGVVVTAIVDRSKTAPELGVHDIILQQEAAMRYLVEGKNPYKETYFGTPLVNWHYDELGKPATNPALYHFVMPPWYLLFPFSIYFMSIPLLGYFDGRMVLLVSMAGLLVVLWKWFKNRLLSALAVTLTALSPATIDYFIEGRSDIFALFWFVWSLFLLERKRYFWSAVIFGLAITSKQTIWFSVPFYFLYLWLTFSSRPRKFWQYLSVTLVVLVAIVAPFLWWDAKAFLESTVFYLSGRSPTSYPVSGYGLGVVLYQAGIIKNLHSYYPFIIWQIAVGVPLLWLIGKWLIKKPAMSRLIFGYGLFLSLVWYLSRYFNNSHLAYLSSIFALGVLKDWDESQKV